MAKEFWEFVSQRTGKPWKAKKLDIVQFWSQLPVAQPLKMRPIAENQHGTRFHNDTIRVTGTPDFINSVMSHLKAVLALESPTAKLELEYRQIESTVFQEQQSFVLYVKLLQK